MGNYQYRISLFIGISTLQSVFRSFFINTHLMVNTDLDRLTSLILIFTDWPTWVIGLCGKKFTHFSQPSYFHAKAQIRTRSIFTQRHKDRTCVFRNLTRWKGKNLKDFGRPHRGQILVTDTLVTVPRPRQVVVHISADPFISSGIKIPHFFGIVFYKG